MNYLRLKFLANVDAGQSPSSDVVSDSGDLPFLQGCAEFGERHPHPTKYCSDPPKRALRGDWLISVRAPVGELNFADQDYGIGRGLAAISARKVDSRFLGYALRYAVSALTSVATGSTYQAVSAPQIASLRIPHPAADTQKAIADFLDRETARIDRLIEKKQRLVVLMQEKDDAVRTHAVTRGLHSDVTLIDSGSVWLRMVPQDWQIIRLKYLFRLLSGYAFKSEFFAKGESDDPVLVTPGSFDPEGGLYPETDSTVRLKGESDARFRLKAEDIVIALTDLSYRKLILGRCEFIPRNGYILNQRVAKVQALRKDVIPSFLRHTINSRPIREQVILGATGATVFHSSSEKVRDISICLPPVAEQQEIAKFLDIEIDQSIEIRTTIRTSIARLYELRSALITAAVTGQIDVATWGQRGATDRRLDDIEVEMTAAAPPEREQVQA